MTRITILGQGAMGSRMADRLETAGHLVTRWNRTGAARTPRVAVHGAEIVIAMVRDDAAAHAVWLDPQDGALAGLGPAAVAVESSTLSPSGIATLAAAFAGAERMLLDAPVLGSRPQAEAGQLIHLVGGDPAVLARVQSALAALGPKQLPVGPLGAGTAMKLLANTLFAGQVALVAELLGLAGSLGLEPEAAFAVLRETPQLSPAAAMAGGLMLAGRDEPLFPAALAAKDLRYAMGERGDAMPLARAALGVFDRAAEAGLGDANLTAIRRLYRGAD